MHSKETLAAACAMLYEGEGSLAILKRSTRPYPQLVIGSTDHDVLVRFNEWIQQLGIFGGISGPYQPKGKSTYKPCWTWRANGWVNLEKTYILFEPWIGKRRRDRFEEVLAMKPTDAYSTSRTTGHEPKRKRKTGITPEGRKRLSDSAKARHARGEFGGAEFGKLGGRGNKREHRIDNQQ